MDASSPANATAIIVQSGDLWLLNTVVVVPTSTSARAATFRPEVVVAGQRTRVLCEQIRTVDSQRLDGMVGILTAAELRNVEDALQIVLEFVNSTRSTAKVGAMVLL